MKLNLVEGKGSGKPVVFQHGLCGSAAQTAEAFPDDPRFRMFTLECRGHGTSNPGPLDAISIKTFADDVATMLGEQDIAPCVMGGISMGAAISLHLAVHKPQLVKALVLARPAWLTAAAPDNNRPNVEVGQLLHSLPPEEAKAVFLAGNTARQLAASAPDNLASLTGFFDRQPVAVTSALLRTIASDGPGVTEAEVRNIKVPTLIIATEQDAIHPLAHAQALHDLIPQSRLAVIPPKGVDKQAYVTAFRQNLLNFFEENA